MSFLTVFVPLNKTLDDEKGRFKRMPIVIFFSGKICFGSSPAL